MTPLARPVAGTAARAAVLTAPRSARVESVALPEPARGEVCVRLEGSGVCGSNLPLWEGRPWFEYPRAPGTPGHEGWGRVAAVGDGVTGWAPGDRVALLSERAFAEYDTAPADALVRLPAALDGQPVPGEALACGVNVFRRARIVSGTTVVVVGIGFLGAVIVQLAARSGAQVIAVSRRGFARDVAAAAGAVATLDGADRGSTAARVHALMPGGAECVIEATGLQEPLDLAGELVRVRGRLVIAGYHQDGRRHVDMQLWNWRGIDVINAHERERHVYRAGMQAAVDAVAAGALDPTPLYTHTLPLDELPRALELLHDRPDGFLKALVAA